MIHCYSDCVVLFLNIIKLERNHLSHVEYCSYLITDNSIGFFLYRVDWVEIREPGSGDLMYANIKTGECLWEAPKTAKV